MSTGTLRRHYRQAAGAKTPAAARPVAEQPKGIETELRAEVERLTAANTAIAEQAARWKAEAVALGWVKPQAPEQPEQPQGTEAEVSDEQKLADAEAEMNKVQAEVDASKPAPPARSAKTAEWVAFAESNPLDPPLDLDPRPGLRDEIAGAYLGEG